MLILVHLDILLIFTQGRCTVCTKRTIGSEIHLDTPDGLLGDIDLVESYFGSFGDSVVSVQDRCTICPYVP